MDYKNTFAFLLELKKNNNKEWFDANKKRYEAVKKDFAGLIETWIKEVGKFDETVHGLEPKNCIFRINRDVRFGKDKSPYKTNMGGAMAAGGRKSGKAGYYLHLEPSGGSFIAGGVHTPEPDVLKKVRQEIDYNFKEFSAIIAHKDFKKHFGQLTGDKLVTVPKGYDTANPAIHLLKHKSFLAWKKYTDKEVLDTGFFNDVMAACKAMKPLDDFLNRAF